MIERARLFRWGGSVPPEVGTARHAFMRRVGLLLAVVDADGRTALGEATPLPDAAGGVQASAEAIASFPWTTARVPSGASELAASIEGARMPAAAAFAVETALATLAAGRRRISLATWVTGRPPERVPRSVYVGILGDDGALVRAERARARGALTLKLKAPCRDVAAEARWLRALRERLGADVRLRLDCNGGLAPVDAPPALEAYAAADLELVEEPCAGEALLELGELAVPWFVDEAVARPELRARLLAHPHVAGVVLKPTSIGGLGASLQLAARARAAGKEVIVTHALEGPVALAACAELALALGSRARPPGLDVHAGLQAFPSWEIPQLPRDGAYVEPAPAACGAPPELPREEIWSWTR